VAVVKIPAAIRDLVLRLLRGRRSRWSSRSLWSAPKYVQGEFDLPSTT